MRFHAFACFCFPVPNNADVQINFFGIIAEPDSDPENGAVPKHFVRAGNVELEFDDVVQIIGVFSGGNFLNPIQRNGFCLIVVCSQSQADGPAPQQSFHLKMATLWTLIPTGC